MTKKIYCILILSFFTTMLHAKGGKDSLQIAMEKEIKFEDSVENALQWQTNSINISNGKAKLNLTKNFKFLNAAQSNFILHDLWNNPPRTDILGMIFPANSGPFTDSSFAFIITYDEEGYVKDEDADKINYDDMLSDIIKGEGEVNKNREKQGYEAIHLMGWAQKPYYDKTNKVLHWAKELKFGNSETKTLNYEVRVLGRKGILSLNAIATMAELSLVKANIDEVLKMPAFTEGNKYSDFNSSTDKVAEYGIGALVAGGILAKTGVLAIIGKFFLVAWKFILIGIAAAWGIIKKFFTGKGKEPKDDYYDRVSDLKP